VFVLSAMVPSYLVDYLKLSAAQTGFVTSALGFGGFFGQFGVPGLSDVFGRKLIAILGFVGSAISVWLLSGIGADATMLFVALFVVSFFCLGNVALITGPIATEAAPAGLVSSAIGIVVGSGEIFGGGVAPSIAGYIAQNYGIENVLFVALSGVVFGAIVCLFLRETAPRLRVAAETGPPL
jgi:sugar phosphate permease